MLKIGVKNDAQVKKMNYCNVTVLMRMIKKGQLVKNYLFLSKNLMKPWAVVQRLHFVLVLV